MKEPGDRTGRTDRARTLAERRTRSHQTPVSRRPAPSPDLTRCERCGVVFWHKTWRRSARRAARAMRAGTRAGTCPACRQARTEQALGRVLLMAELDADQERALQRRIANVCQRAAFTQPERRLLQVRRVPEGLEVLTTSQELAHRVAKEVEKAFGGSVDYDWSDREGRLLARWHPAPPTTGRRLHARGRRPQP